jgi:hypothetical protein
MTRQYPNQHTPARFLARAASAARAASFKSACRKLSPGIQSFDNLARDWHTMIAVVPVLSEASDHTPLMPDQDSLSLIQ